MFNLFEINDDHWRLTWSLTSRPVRIIRGARKLAETPYVNKKKLI
jgi:hypothetical protein